MILKIPETKIVCSTFFLIVLVFSNKYIMAEHSYLGYFFLLMIFCFKYYYKISFHLLIKNHNLYFLFLCLYFVARTDIRNLDFYDLRNTSYLFYFVTFIVTSQIFIRQKNFSSIFLILIFVYTAVFTSFISLDLNASKQGSNLSHASVPFTFFPFILLWLLSFKSKSKYAFTIMFISFTVILFLWTVTIGARSNAIGYLLFLIIYFSYPLLKKRRFLYNVFFVSANLIFILLCLFYVFYDISWNSTHDTSFRALSKSSETRKAIWANVFFYISNSNYLIGSGTSFSSEFLSPILDNYKLHRDNLASHSTILEIVIRTGLVGLIIFFCFLYSLWNYLFKSKSDQVKIVTCYIIMILPTLYSSIYLFFSAFLLKSFFIWILLGAGVGLAYQENSKNHGR